MAKEPGTPGEKRGLGIPEMARETVQPLDQKEMAEKKQLMCHQTTAAYCQGSERKESYYNDPNRS